MRSPATLRCWSTASLAIARCMISDEPSMMRLARTSRRDCSTGTPRTPRAASDAAVVALLVSQPAGHVQHGLKPERGSGDEPDLLRHLVVLADRLAPLDASIAEFPGHLGGPLRRPRALRSHGHPPRVERAQRHPQPESFAADDVLAGREDIGEAGERVLDAVHAHEVVARLGDDPLGFPGHDESGD